MNLFDMISQAQGGNGIAALSRQFNLSQKQTESAVEALLPAFSQAFRQNSADPYGLGSLLTALGSGKHAQYAEDATKAFSPQGMAEGKGILDHLFGSKDLSRAVAAQASQATGVGQDTLKQMLPAIATMLMGSLFKQTNNKVQAGAFGASNPLGQIIEQMMKGQGGAGTAAVEQPAGRYSRANPGWRSGWRSGCAAGQQPARRYSGTDPRRRPVARTPPVRPARRQRQSIGRYSRPDPWRGSGRPDAGTPPVRAARRQRQSTRRHPWPNPRRRRCAGRAGRGTRRTSQPAAAAPHPAACASTGAVKSAGGHLRQDFRPRWPG